MVARALARAWLLVLASAAACASKSPDLTQLILVSDTDIPTLDTIELEIEGPSGRRESTKTAVPDDGSPIYLTLLRDEGPLGPLTITARGYEGDAVIVERTVQVSFVVGETRVVELFLIGSCVTLQSRCGDDETCTEDGCQPQELAPESLPPWRGEPPSLQDTNDGGPDVVLTSCPDAGMVDLLRDPKNCGECGKACLEVSAVFHAVAVCELGTCDFDCEPLYGDCDGSRLSGCEQELTESSHCGACDNACSLFTEACSPTGTCEPR